MSRTNRVLAGTTILGCLTSLWLYLDNRSLREEVEQKTAAIEEAATKPAAEQDQWLDAKKRDGRIAFNATAGPQLPEKPHEHRLDRRVRRTEEFAAMFGREPGETEQQWRDRVMPLVQAALGSFRVHSQDNRNIAEQKAGVTPEQSKKIDEALLKKYDEVLDYTNKAIKDGTLSPYERNVAGWMEFAGGLGGMLNDTQGQIGKILGPAQMKAMYDAGFEWGEYMGAQIPWENIAAPPPRAN